MAGVPQKTLNWLYNSVVRDYRDPNRTYSDLAHTLARYPGLAPRTDVYTYEDGRSALLAHFVGTIPVTFRNTTYRFPIALWIPHEYPYDAPLVYVAPTEDMIVRPGQHVGGDGRIYHHYLAHWREAWDRSNVVDLLSILSDVFAKEPPVMSKQQSSNVPPVPRPNVGPPPPVPPLPHELQRPSSTPHSPSARPNIPPKPPPKQSALNDNASSSMEPRRSEEVRSNRYESPPPRPPIPPGDFPYQPEIDGRRTLGAAYYPPQRTNSLQQQMASNRYFSGSIYQNQQAPHSMTAGPPPAPTVVQSPMSSSQQPQTYTAAPHVSGPNQQATFTQVPQRYSSEISRTQSPQGPYQQGQPPIPYQQPQSFQAAPRQEPKKPAPAVDLLSSPFDVTLPVSANLPVPPVPPNPEKDAVLSAISTAITQNLHNTIAQNNAALPPLQAQHAAMLNTYQTLESELANLTSLNNTLTFNVSILQNSLQKANAAIAAAKERATRGDVPKVDEILTAPTVVGRQLYDVVCEERGIEAGLWALQEGLIKGRIGAEVWAKKTRELARDGFRKKVLAQKIARGMALEGAV